MKAADPMPADDGTAVRKAALAGAAAIVTLIIALAVLWGSAFQFVSALEAAAPDASSLDARTPLAVAGLISVALGACVWAVLALLRLRRRDLRRFEAARADLARAVNRNAESAAAASERERQAGRAQSEFITSMSHEIRTAMNGVIGMADLLLRGRLETKERHYAGTIHRSGRALLRTLDDIVEYAQAAAGLLRIEQTTFSLPHAVREIEQLFGEPARVKGVRLSVSVSPSLAAYVVGDPVRLRQVLVNLVSNALQVTEGGELVVSVAARDGERVRFEVLDGGPRIPAELESGLFTAFSSDPEPIVRGRPGARLGLAICRQLVDRMGGAIGAHNDADRGARFWFEIPLRTTTLPVPQVGDAASAGRFAGKSVLLVEDDPISAEIARAMLTRCGIVTVCTGNGKEALGAFSRQRFDLVLMDCQMPVMDGFEATRRIRDTEAARAVAGTPIIAVTAHATDGYRQQCIAAGMDDYLSKPFDSAALEFLLQRWLAAPERQPVTLSQ